jgi:phenylpropionate dioxygenase-like ring-hydroxylating dioxygenase large terminal subunit
VSEQKCDPVGSDDHDHRTAASQRRQAVLAPELPPFPEGWYFVESRKAVEKAGLLQKTWMGENIVVWCDPDGRICVAEAICPHQGADLGPSAGGRVCEGRLVCPFHGYEFDTAGQCVATPFAPAPKTARLRIFETHDINGLIFAW